MLVTYENKYVGFRDLKTGRHYRAVIDVDGRHRLVHKITKTASQTQAYARKVVSRYSRMTSPTKENVQ
jgi:hypothetical protein